LQEAWRLSRRVWVTVDSGGLPAALFGIAPMDKDEAVGRFWILAFDAFDDANRDFRAVARLVFDEMLQEFDRVEKVIDCRKTWTIDLLKSVGFCRRTGDDPCRFPGRVASGVAERRPPGGSTRQLTGVRFVWGRPDGLPPICVPDSPVAAL
jgi:hypothetical protein